MKKNFCGEVVIKKYQMDDFIDVLLTNGYLIEIEDATPDGEYHKTSCEIVNIKFYKNN